MNIQRLDLALRNSVGLNKAAARTMHVVSDAAINPEVVNISRYNVRTPDGTIAKFTVGENNMTVSYLKNINGSYKEVKKQICEGSADKVSSVFAEILSKVGKSSK